MMSEKEVGTKKVWLQRAGFVVMLAFLGISNIVIVHADIESTTAIFRTTSPTSIPRIDPQATIPTFTLTTSIVPTAESIVTSISAGASSSPSIVRPTVTFTATTQNGSTTTSLSQDGGLTGLGAAIGCFVKFDALNSLGSPMPNYRADAPDECPPTSATTTPPSPPAAGTSTATLIVIKLVNGSATSSNFMIHVKRASTTLEVSGSPQAGSAMGTTYLRLAAGDYIVSESGGPSGYIASFSGDCGVQGKITLRPNATSTCTITNIPGGLGGGGGDPILPPTGGGNPAPGPGGGNPTPGPGSGGPPPGPNGVGGPPYFGGGNGPPTSGAAPSPAQGSGNTAPAGQVLGASTTTPGIGGYTPEAPNTGVGGSQTTVLMTLALSLISMLAGMYALKARRRTHY